MGGLGEERRDGFADSTGGAAVVGSISLSVAHKALLVNIYADTRGGALGLREVPSAGARAVCGDARP